MLRSGIVLLAIISSLAHAMPAGGQIDASDASTLPSANFELIDVSTGSLREMTAFNSVPEQTDSTPCLAADGTDICLRYQAGECIIAENGVKFGTKRYIDGYGECSVADRVSKKYGHRIDLFLDKDLAAAKKFGVQHRMVKNLK